MSVKKRIRNENKRILVLASAFCLAVVSAFGATLYTMVSKKHLWSQNSAFASTVRNSVQTKTIQGSRGTIYDRTGTVLADQTEAYTIVANFDTRTNEEKAQDEKTTEAMRQSALESAKEDGRTEQVTAALEAQDAQESDPYVTDINAFASAVKSVLGDLVNEDDVLYWLKYGQENNKSQVELGPGTKRITRDQKEKLESMKIPGMSFTDTTTREYPVSPFSSNLLGFAAYDDDTGTLTGRIGLEQTLDYYLAGTDGQVQYSATSTGEILPGSEVTLSDATNGYDVHLTLDSSLQQTVEEQMSKTMTENNATKAWCVVMECETGKILAWASYPTYDQNTHMEIEQYSDNVSDMNFEPGSVVKPLVYAMTIDAGTYPYNQTYRAYSFAYTADESSGKITRVSDSQATYPVIYDALQTDYGTLTFADGLAHSSNVGICELLSNYLTREQFDQYCDAFGLFQQTGIPYVPESTGVKNTSSAQDYLSSGFGQASSMTVLQLCQAYTALFNDGIMMRPYVVESITDSSTGQAIQKFSPEVAGTPVSSQAASEVRQMMRHVLDEGMSGDRFAMDDVDMCAKTGTGEIYNEQTGTYDKTYYTSSLMAAAPTDDPKVMVYWGMVSANYLNYSAEPFQTIMRAALKAANVNTGTSTSVTDEYDQWESYTMPTLVNHSLDYATNKMADKAVHTVVLGDGTSVIRQFPSAGTTINSNDTVLLLTDGANLTMPDMIGWTRKDLTAFWELTGISVTATGYGMTTWQSVEAGTPIQSDTAIEVILEQQKTTSSDGT